MNVKYETKFKLEVPVKNFDDARDYLGKDNMVEYLDTNFKNDIISIYWLLDGETHGRIEVIAKRELTKTELHEFSQWIYNQCSNGIGEGFEKQDFAYLYETEEDRANGFYYLSRFERNSDYKLKMVDSFKQEKYKKYLIFEGVKFKYSNTKPENGIFLEEGENPSDFLKNSMNNVKEKLKNEIVWNMTPYNEILNFNDLNEDYSFNLFVKHKVAFENLLKEIIYRVISITVIPDKDKEILDIEFTVKKGSEDLLEVLQKSKLLEINMAHLEESVYSNGVYEIMGMNMVFFDNFKEFCKYYNVTPNYLN